MSRTSEHVLEILIASDLATGSPAARLVWEAAGWEMPRNPAVLRGTRRSDRRETDLEVRDGHRRLLIEVKTRTGKWQEGQADSYRIEQALDPINVAVVVVAPALWLTMYETINLAAVSVESLAGALELEGRRSSTELACGFMYRASLFRGFTRPTRSPRRLAQP